MMPSKDADVIAMLTRLEEEARCKYIDERDPQMKHKRKILWEDAQDRLQRWQLSKNQSSNSYSSIAIMDNNGDYLD